MIHRYCVQLLAIMLVSLAASIAYGQNLSSPSASKASRPSEKSEFEDEYQRWLKAAGLSRWFELDGAAREGSEDGVMTLTLRSVLPGKNWFASYETFRIDFKRAREVDINEELFFRMVHLFNLPPTRAKVKILGPAACAILVTWAGSRGVVSSLTDPECGVVPKYRTGIVRISEGEIRAGTEGLVRDGIGVGQYSGSLLSRLRSAFVGKGRLEVIEDDNDYVQVNIRDLRAEVISDMKLWEVLQISVVRRHKESESEVRCFVSGRFGSGFNPPKEADMKDMDSTYGAQLQDYTQQLCSRLATGAIQ